VTTIDAVVIGAGAAGLTVASLLAKEGRSVVVCEAGSVVGGRGMAVPAEGFKLNFGAHLLEDSGSGITKVFEYVGKELKHGAVSSEMPVWDEHKGRWRSIRDGYAGDKRDLKRVIAELVEMPYEELERWDERPLREWMLQFTHDQGVIDLWEFFALLECLTDEWYDHSASDNLYVRKMHYSEQRVGGYSFWPEQGWDRLFEDLRDAVVEHGGEVRMATPVETVLIEDGVVKGVRLAGDRLVPNEVLEGEVLEAACVVSTLPVWSVLDVVPAAHLPDWYVEQIRFLAQDRWRVAWLGLYLATREPVFAIDPLELSTWLHAPLTRTPGFFFNMTMMDPSVSPAGTNLYVAGGIIPAERARDATYVAAMFERFEEELKIMYPGLREAYWRRRHLVFDPPFGVIQKPGLVGVFRPHWRAPNVDGLYFASETFRSRGIGVDRAARAGLTVAEDYLGRRLDGGFGWRY
jgi:phytoene dehydrogenase-like protein